YSLDMNPIDAGAGRGRFRWCLAAPKRFSQTAVTMRGRRSKKYACRMLSSIGSVGSACTQIASG
ncbi:MAG: hypothetical protein M1305_01270, partial [Candidatus Marsarchaeota archaeon]|nr:hypothetical protein [Candidatus Marsarchaeota archaeon]